MGTSGAYTGSSSKAAKALRDRIVQHLDAIPTASEPKPVRLDPADVARVLNLIRPRSHAGAGDGPGGGGGGGSGGGGGGGGGPHRSAAASARGAGRAAAAAHAYRTGDVETLQRLGLDYDELRSLGDDYEVLRRIVDIACAAPDSTIDDHEQRLIAAEVAEWVLAQESDGDRPTPEQIVRQAIAVIIAETVLVETGAVVNISDHAAVAEDDIRDAAEALAAQATLSVQGVTEDELSRAVEAGLDTLRGIVTGGD